MKTSLGRFSESACGRNVSRVGCLVCHKRNVVLGHMVVFHAYYPAAYGDEVGVRFFAIAISNVVSKLVEPVPNVK